MATWNVNSIRARLDRVRAYLAQGRVDVLALQETKVRDQAFPAEALDGLGYQVAHFGLNQWNGVAVFSRVGLADVERSFPGQPGWGQPPALEARALGATCGGIRVWSLYVPHGRGAEHPHMAYKLSWLEALRAAAAGWLDADPRARIALLGDWNVAPEDTDVWDPSVFEGLTHTSAPERAAFAAFAHAGYREVTREQLPAPHTYTQWDYQQLRFPRDQGMRIDFAYCSPALADQVSGARIVRDERRGKGASDHVPVEIDVDCPPLGGAAGLAGVAGLGGSQPSHESEASDAAT
ncbi:MAG: endonuclease/exonuclease/phosphatase family protein [Bifidobacteriaceae bacterium]|jgi:exodeoxyribonuclease-3|nr:endonuclease/exonuclease/phosphatase family protein [Bifidobacteriaceae bacterium]